MTSLAEVEIASTVANLVISLLIVPRRRSLGEVEVEEPATSAGRTVINLGIVLLNPPMEEGTASIVVSLAICRRTVRRRGNLGEVEDLVMGVERKVTSLETALRRPVGVVVAVASTVVKMVISYVFLTLFGT
jgi:hypothetical protein